MYTCSSIRDHIIPKSLKCHHSATKGLVFRLHQDLGFGKGTPGIPWYCSHTVTVSIMKGLIYPYYEYDSTVTGWGQHPGYTVGL